jgi:hypothetical protein
MSVSVVIETVEGPVLGHGREEPPGLGRACSPGGGPIRQPKRSASAMILTAPIAAGLPASAADAISVAFA